MVCPADLCCATCPSSVLAHSFFCGLSRLFASIRNQSRHQVAIPVIIAIGVPLIFLVWTTVTPSLQAFVLCLPIAGRVKRVPEQCPYKSTQSRILCHIITFSKPLFLFISRSIIAFHSLVVLFPLRLLNQSMENASTVDKFERQWLFEAIFETWYEKKWLKFDQAWLTLRDAYGEGISDGEWCMSQMSRYRSGRVGGLYDLTNGIHDIIGENIDSTIQSSAFHCIQDLISSVSSENSQLDSGDIKHNQWLQKLLSNREVTEPFHSFLGILKNPPHDLLLEENSFIFLSQCGELPLTSLQHFAELHIHIFNYIYPEQPLTFTSDKFPSYPDELCLYNYGKKTTNRDAAFDAHEYQRNSIRFISTELTLIDISAQFSLSVKSFVQSARNHDIRDETLLASFHGHGLGEFLRYATLRQSEHSIEPTINLLSTALTHYTTGDSKFGKRSDFMFYVSAFYARSLMILDPWHFHYWTSDTEWDENPIVEAFLPVLRHYLQERGTPDVALGEQSRIPALSDSWWGFLNRDLKKIQDSSQEMSDKFVRPSPMILPCCVPLMRNRWAH